MMGYEELISGLIKFGRGNVQEFVIRSENLNDAISYLWAELLFDLNQYSTFKTKDLLNFEKKEKENENKFHSSFSQAISHSKNNQEKD